MNEQDLQAEINRLKHEVSQLQKKVKRLSEWNAWPQSIPTRDGQYLNAIDGTVSVHHWTYSHPVGAWDDDSRARYWRWIPEVPGEP